jgi:hypothetical protein
MDGFAFDDEGDGILAGALRRRRLAFAAGREGATAEQGEGKEEQGQGGMRGAVGETRRPPSSRDVRCESKVCHWGRVRIRGPYCSPP